MEIYNILYHIKENVTHFNLNRKNTRKIFVEAFHHGLCICCVINKSTKYNLFKAYIYK